MKQKLTFTEIRHSLRQRIDIDKVARYAVLINSVQIAAAVFVATLSIIRRGHLFTGDFEIAVLCVMALIVVWGGFVDIREAFAARRISEDTDILEEVNNQLETLNITLRSQRHDFMNHLQVVYSLMEMDERSEAMAYIERVYDDIQRVGRTLKTSIPAINALLAAKLSDCDERGIRFDLLIGTSWEHLPMPGWEMCRILGNLIDNSVEALKDTPNPRLSLQLDENIHEFTFTVENNGPAILAEHADRIFQSGFTTKRSGNGLGLSIVKGLIEAYGGDIAVASDDATTRFCGTIRKNAVAAEDTEAMAE